MPFVPAETLAERTRIALRRAGKTQTQVAEETGLSQGAVSMALKPSPSYASTLATVARAAGFDVRGPVPGYYVEGDADEWPEREYGRHYVKATGPDAGEATDASA
jgi:transcriptional regulator with XRE-family HTH domain